ncbi:MAG: glycosyltransferase [Blastocatellia bacterium]|nr:MAG: glycosyltransferase [Blastocatellia bacterium]
MKISVLTDIPSPYQVEILNEIAQDKENSLQVIYLRRRDPSRQWKEVPICHDAISLGDGPSCFTEARRRHANADLVVFNYYHHPFATALIEERARSMRPWCFWGERPGLRKPEWAGRLFRMRNLRWLHSSAAPIWGIGKFAVDTYRSEFGSQRQYFNLPYFSNLQRFRDTLNSRNGANAQTFLFSGSLIKRKGIDLLANAFMRLLREGHNARLRIVGDGPLRSSLGRTLGQVESAVEFVGFVDWSELMPQYATSDVLCVPSHYDGWGMVVPEGLASGLPVIATDRTGAALEFIEAGRNGWLIPAGDGDALFNAMREAVIMPASKFAQLSQEAQQSVANHSLEHGASRFKQYSAQVVSAWTT